MPRPHTHPSLEALRASLRALGDRIVANGLPDALGPLTIAIIGKGRVGTGARDILAEIGYNGAVRWVNPKDLEALVNDPSMNSTPLDWRLRN